ncbi:MAG: cyanophycinase [Flavobacteriaceae bacterium]
MSIKGTLIPIGGNEDKGTGNTEQYTLEFIQEGILSRVVRESGGNAANIVVLPTASSIPKEVGENYLHAFGKLGCDKVDVLHLMDREDSERKKNIDLIRKADCVMFSGGDQSKIKKIIGGTRMHQLLIERYRKEPVVIAGTSAGAMCMSGEMITGGSSKDSLFKGAVGMSKGMDFIPNLIIDSHFIQRGRFGRLAEAVAKFPKLLGVGLAEDTGLVIKNCNTFEVIGSGMVVLFDPSRLKHNNEKVLEIGSPMSLSNLRTHILANGDRFNIKKRKLQVLPLDSPFV